LKTGQQHKQENPENSHGVPVPGRAIDHNLPHFHAPQQEQRAKRDHKRKNAEDKVDSMDRRNQIEEVAVLGGREIQSL
jgi:hypothetical protein